MLEKPSHWMAGYTEAASRQQPDSVKADCKSMPKLSLKGSTWKSRGSVCITWGIPLGCQGVLEGELSILNQQCRRRVHCDIPAH